MSAGIWFEYSVGPSHQSLSLHNLPNARHTDAAGTDETTATTETDVVAAAETEETEMTIVLVEIGEET